MPVEERLSSSWQRPYLGEQEAHGLQWRYLVSEVRQLVFRP